jgi:hypothetical protein
MGIHSARFGRSLRTPASLRRRNAGSRSNAPLANISEGVAHLKRRLSCALVRKPVRLPANRPLRVVRRQ